MNEPRPDPHSGDGFQDHCRKLLVRWLHLINKNPAAQLIRDPQLIADTEAAVGGKIEDVSFGLPDSIRELRKLYSDQLRMGRRVRSFLTQFEKGQDDKTAIMLAGLYDAKLIADRIAGDTSFERKSRQGAGMVSAQLDQRIAEVQSSWQPSIPLAPTPAQPVSEVEAPTSDSVEQLVQDRTKIESYCLERVETYCKLKRALRWMINADLSLHSQVAGHDEPYVETPEIETVKQLLAQHPELYVLEGLSAEDKVKWVASHPVHAAVLMLGQAWQHDLELPWYPIATAHLATLAELTSLNQRMSEMLNGLQVET